MINRGFKICSKEQFKGTWKLLLMVMIMLLSSCYRQYFRVITIAGETTKEDSKEEMIRLMLGVKKYTIVHYGSYDIHLQNAKMDSNYLSGVAAKITTEHQNIKKEIYANKRMRSEHRAAILDEFHLFISRYKISNTDSNMMLIPLQAIKRIDINQRASIRNFGFNTITTIGYASLLTIALLPVICNCPHVKVIGKDTVVFEGTLFPGAMGKTLQRTDHLVIKNVPLNEEGRVKLQIMNELPEVEFIDQVQLHEVTKMPYQMLATGQEDGLVSFNFGDSIYSATTQNNKVITHVLQKKDTQMYDYREPGSDHALNKVYLTFRNRRFIKDPVLLVNAKQDKWIENLAEYGFNQLGTKFGQWTKRINKADPEKFSQRATAKGLSIGVYIKINNKWHYAGNIENVGTLAYRMKALKLDVSRIESEFIELKLEAAHAFWDLDYAGISDEWSNDVETRELKTFEATDHQENDVLNAISSANKAYHELHEKGNYIDLLFEPPADANAYLVVRGSGYYNHVRNYTHKPNYGLLKYLHNNVLSYHQLSRQFYFQDRIARLVYKPKN